MNAWCQTDGEATKCHECAEKLIGAAWACPSHASFSGQAAVETARPVPTATSATQAAAMQHD